MATLTNTPIKDRYKSLLKITGTANDVFHAITLKLIEDGDGNDSALQLAQNRLEIVPVANHANAFEVSQADGTQIFNINSTTPGVLVSGSGVRLYFSDVGGEYISGNGSILSMVGGSEIDLTATTIDINGAADISGALTIGGNIDFNSGTIDLSTQTVDVTLNNAADALNFDSNTLSIDASNNRVGIGTNAPGYLLELADTTGPSFALHRSDDSIGNGDSLGTIYFTGAGGEDAVTDERVGAMIRAEGAHTWTSHDENKSTELQFFTQANNDSDALAAPRMTIDYAGFVGIGIAAPTATLHVDQSTPGGAAPVLRLDQGDEDETFIDFIGTSAVDGAANISSDTTTESAKFGAIRIEINGVHKWIRIYDDHS